MAMREKQRKRSFPDPNYRYPFTIHRVFNEDTRKFEITEEKESPKFAELHNGPLIAMITLMAFERAFECGGWRAATFMTWFKENLDEMQVELVEKIENRLYQLLKMDGEKLKRAHQSEIELESWKALGAVLKEKLYGE